MAGTVKGGKGSPEVDAYAARMSGKPATTPEPDPAPVSTPTKKTPPVSKSTPAKKTSTTKKSTPAKKTTPATKAPSTKPATKSGSPKVLTPPSPSGGVSMVDSGAGFVLGLLVWTWIGLPFLKGGPKGVKDMLRAKFLNKAPDGSWLP
jgi:hypothetical protein